LVKTGSWSGMYQKKRKESIVLSFRFVVYEPACRFSVTSILLSPVWPGMWNLQKSGKKDRGIKKSMIRVP
jgi:hypothetical protein